MVNIIGGVKPNGAPKPTSGQASDAKQLVGPQTLPPTPEQVAAEQQKRFEEMRARLLGQDARVD